MSWEDQHEKYVRDVIAETWAHLAGALSQHPSILNELTTEEGGALKHEQHLVLDNGAQRVVTIQIEVRDSQGLALQTIESKLRQKLDETRRDLNELRAHSVLTTQANLRQREMLLDLRAKLDAKEQAELEAKERP